MKSYLLLLLCLLPGLTPAQDIESASGGWQKITLPKPPPTQPAQATPPPDQTAVVSAPAPMLPPSRQARPTSGYVDPNAPRPVFTGDFVTKRNGWKAGNQGDYYYQLGMGKYEIRKRTANTRQVAFSYVPLPAEINLNIADAFTIKVDMLADSGRVPTGGLLFGVRDSLNYCAFRLNSTGEISIIRVANGTTFSDYMPGDYYRPGVELKKNYNRLTIRRRGDALHFYVNEQEVRSSPYPFRLLPGNSIGFTTTAYWTAFQKLSVTLGN